MSKKSELYKFVGDIDGNLYLLPERLWPLWEKITQTSPGWWGDEAKEIINCRIELSSDYCFENPRLISDDAVDK